MNFFDVPEFLGLSREEVLEHLSGTILVYGVGILLAVALSWYAYEEHQANQARWRRAKNFSKDLTRYRRLSALRSGQKSQSDPIENPLAYLENQVSQEKLGGLSPLGSEDGRERYRLALEGVSSSVAVQLMKTLDDKRGVSIDSYSMERVSLDSKSFDARFELSVAQ